MADDKQDRSEQDRARVAGDQDYEVRYFADKHGISIDRAQQLIDEHGNSREGLEAAVSSLRR